MFECFEFIQETCSNKFFISISKHNLKLICLKNIYKIKKINKKQKVIERKVIKKKVIKRKY